MIRERGKIRILFDLARFHGWSKGTRWFDINRYFPEVERVAFVGDPKCEKNIGAFCNPFPSAQLRYFESGCSVLTLESVNARETAPLFILPFGLSVHCMYGCSFGQVHS